MKQHVKTLLLCLLLCIGQSLYAQVAFRHVTSAANVSAHITTLDHPQLNGKPNALLFILPNYNLNGAEAGGQNYLQNAGVWYNGSRWTIFNQNTKEPMPLNMTFNVMIAPPNSPNCFTFTATQARIEANGFPNGAVIDHPATNGKTNAMLLVTQNWAGVYNDASQAVHYHKNEWRISNNGYDAYWRGETTDSRCLMPAGSRFNVMVIENGAVPGFPNAQTFMHTANKGNTPETGKWITYLEPANLVGDKDVMLFATAYWGHSDANRTGPHQAGGPYNEGPLVAWYDHPADAWPTKDTYWSLYNSNGVPMAEGAKINVVTVIPDSVPLCCAHLFAPKVTKRDTATLTVTGIFGQGPETIKVEVVGGYVIFQGDMILGREKDFFTRSGGKLVPKKNPKKGKGTRNTGTPDLARRWPDGVIPFEIVAGHPATAAINRAIATINRLTNLCIRPRTNEVNFVRFTNLNDERNAGCWSWVGRQGGMQQLNIGDGCGSERIALHEILHAAGVFHEQSRPDRDNHVRINWNNIEAGQAHNFERLTQAVSICTYDFRSIMHYGPFDFSANGQRTITTIDPAMQNVIGRGTGLSDCDISGIRNLYLNARGCDNGGGNLFTCLVAFSQVNYQGQRFEMCARGPHTIPFEVKSIQIPVGWEVSYIALSGECFPDQVANSIVSAPRPSLSDNPPCPQWPFYVVSKPDGLNKLKVTVTTGQDELRGGNRFFFTLHMHNGFSFPEIPVIPPNGLVANSTYTFEITVFNSPAENNLNHKDIAAFTIRHDGRPRNGHPFDTYGNWDCRSVLLDWDGRVPKAMRFAATRFTGELTSRRYEAY